MEQKCFWKVALLHQPLICLFQLDPTCDLPFQPVLSHHPCTLLASLRQSLRHSCLMKKHQSSKSEGLESLLQPLITSCYHPFNVPKNYFESELETRQGGEMGKKKIKKKLSSNYPKPWAPFLGQHTISSPWIFLLSYPMNQVGETLKLAINTLTFHQHSNSDNLVILCRLGFCYKKTAEDSVLSWKQGKEKVTLGSSSVISPSIDTLTQL